MSDISKGVLIYNEWFEAMRPLDSDDFKAIALAIYDLQIHNTPPPEFEGVARAIASIIFPYIERRKQQAERGRAGAAARYSKEYSELTDHNTSANDTAISQNENKLNKSKSIYNQIKLSESASPSAAGGRASAGGFATHKKASGEHSSFDTQEFYEAAVKRALGDEIGTIALMKE